MNQPQNDRPLPFDRYLTPREVAEIVNVDPKTVSRWAKQGRLPCVRLPSGHRRFRSADVRALLDGET